MAYNIHSILAFFRDGAATKLPSGQHLVLPSENDAATPTLAFGDGESGIYESVDNTLTISTNTVRRFSINSAGIVSVISGGAIVRYVVPTSTAPGFAFSGDYDTGIGRAAADSLSLIAGGIEALRLIEDSTIEVRIAKNDSWLTELNYAGSDVINMFKVNVDDEIECGGTLHLGSIVAEEDSGQVTIYDMPVSATPAAGTEESFATKVDGDTVVTVGAHADSAGGVTGRFMKTDCAMIVRKTDAGAADYNPSTLTSDYIITVNTSIAVRNVIISTEDRDSGTPSNPRVFIIHDIAGDSSLNPITVSLETSGTINGAATHVIQGDFDSITLMVDGTNGYII